MEEDNAFVIWLENSHFTEESFGHKLMKARQRAVLESEAEVIIPETQVIIPRVPGEHEEFVPRIISIGPYYWGTRRLRSMDEKKHDYAAAFLERNRVPGAYLINELSGLVEDVGRCYSEVSHIDLYEFGEMMLFDGCFIIEYMHRVDISRKEDHISRKEVDELIMSMRPIIEHDLLLLQNQLPFFVLKAIVDTCMPRHDSYSFLSNLILNFFNHSSFIQKTPSVNDLSRFHFEHAQHLLHFYHWCLIFAAERPMSRVLNPLKSIKVNFQKMSGFCFPLSSNKKLSEDDLPEKDVWSIPSATVLASAGVKFKKKDGSFLLQICFREGNMEIPSFFIDGCTGSLIKNLIAFEKFNPAIEPRFTAYVKFLNHLINTSEDVALLHKKRVLDHALGSEKEVAHLINSMGGSTFHH